MKQQINASADVGSMARQSNIEVLRIVAMMMIVGCHFATHGGFNFDSGSITIPRIWCNFIEMGGNLGVDIFILTSGYFLISDDYFGLNVKKIIRLWGQIFFYSIVCFAYTFLTGKSEGGVIVIIKTLLPVTFSCWWFASTYFVLYLLHPFINRLLKGFNKRQFQLFLLLILFLWSIIPTFTASNYQSNHLIEFFMLYTIAGYLRIYGLNPQLKTKHYFSLWLLFTAVTYLSCIVFLLLGIKMPVFSSHATYFYGRASVLTLASAVCLFMTFATMRMKYHGWINKIASATFGVYLIHDSNVFRTFLWQDIFRNAAFQDTNYIIIYSMLVTLIVYIVCTCIDLLRKNIFETLFMKLVSRYIDGFLAPFKSLVKKFGCIIFGKEGA